MKKAISLVLCLILTIIFTGCTGASDTGSSSSSDSSDVTVTGTGNEYTAYVDEDAPSCTVEYLGASLDVDEGEFISDEDDGNWFVLHMTYTNDLDLISHDSNVDDIENQDALYRSFVVRAVQGEKFIDPRDEIDAETFEEQNSYAVLDAGGSTECEYWFDVDVTQPVTIQILNPDGEDTVMAELTFSPETDDF